MVTPVSTKNRLMVTNVSIWRFDSVVQINILPVNVTLTDTPGQDGTILTVPVMTETGKVRIQKKISDLNI